MKLSEDFIYADLSDLQELENTIERLGKVPKRSVKQSVGAGARVMRKHIKDRAPKGKTGNLRRAIRIVHEKHRGRVAKAGSQITFDRQISKDHLVKFSKSGKRAFYPVSQDAGWWVMRKTKNGYEKAYRKDGQDYMKSLSAEAYPAAEQAMVKKLTEQLDKEWRKKSAT